MSSYLYYFCFFRELFSSFTHFGAGVDAGQAMFIKRRGRCRMLDNAQARNWEDIFARLISRLANSHRRIAYEHAWRYGVYNRTNTQDFLE